MRECLRPAAPEQELFRLRAQLAADVARRTEDSAEPFAGSVDAILCDLYRQSIHWSRSALSFAKSGAASDPKDWQAIDVTLQERAVAGPELLTRVQLAVDVGSFPGFAELPDEERLALLPALRSLALALLAELAVNKRALEALWAQRIVRVGLVLGLIASCVFVVARLSDGAEQARDIARDKPWRTSSALSVVTPCISPQQDCPQSPEFFFHTTEELRPWVEIDLGSAQTFSAVRVDNRKDCCSERAVPLMVEVSSDQEHWRNVARRESVFSSWLANFPPVTARYVRLRIDRRESLHLQRVRVLR
jgi:hypothetical protein